MNKKILLCCSFILASYTGAASASSITITISGDLFVDALTDEYNLHGAHFNLSTTIDTSTPAYVQNSFSSFDDAYYRYFDTNATFTNRSNGASDASATALTTVNTQNSHSGSDAMELIYNAFTFGGEFSALNFNAFLFNFDSSVFGPNGFAAIPESWTSEQQLNDFIFSDINFYKNGDLYYTGSNIAVTTEFSTVPVPAAIWLFGSGLLGLVGVARRKKA